jgi:predicted CopG family antitoxin
MQKKLTITVDEGVYRGLYKTVGRRRISHFIEELVRPHVISADLTEGYRAMAADEVREGEALEWAENLAGEVRDEPR